MSTIERPDRHVLPPLEAGQRLDQPTFHERYKAMPPGTRAELIGGVVYMPSPLSRNHGQSTCKISGWLFHYRRFTPGIRSAGNATVKLGPFGEHQPDNLLVIPEHMGGQSRIDADGYLTGPPELIVEIARSSRLIDLGPKKRDYELAGVPEYLVIEIDPDRVHWFVLREGRYIEKAPDADGVFRSEVFPGLWLDPSAFYANDLRPLITALDRGLATPEHAAFVARLSGADRPL